MEGGRGWACFATSVLQLSNKSLLCHLLSETRVTREHDAAMNKLFDWLARFEAQLNETLGSVKEFYGKDRLSEAKMYLAQLDELRDKIQGFLDEVSTVCYIHFVFKVLVLCLTRTSFVDVFLGECVGSRNVNTKQQLQPFLHKLD